MIGRPALGPAPAGNRGKDESEREHARLGVVHRAELSDRGPHRLDRASDLVVDGSRVDDLVANRFERDQARAARFERGLEMIESRLNIP